MLDKEEFESDGKSSDQIIKDAIAGPLLLDFNKEMNKRLLADIVEAAAKMPILLDPTAKIEWIELNDQE